MATATVDNGPGIPKLNRGRPVKVGTLTALEHVVAFSLGYVQEFSAKSISIFVPSGTVTTFAIEFSLDGGTTWVVIPAASATVPAGYSLMAITGQATNDAAASFAAIVPCQGLGGALFHFGVLTGTITASDVWVLAD